MSVFKVQYQHGFTLMEMLVTIVVLGIIGGVVASIFFSVLTMSSKAQNIAMIRQNGNYALTLISNIIQNAQSFDGVSINGSDGSFTTTCSSGTTYNYLRLTDNYGSKILFACLQPASGPPTIASADATMPAANRAYTPLIDPVGVAVQACSFTCASGSTQTAPSVILQFTLKKNSSSKLPEQSIVSFKTTTNFLNFSR